MNATWFDVKTSDCYWIWSEVKWMLLDSAWRLLLAFSWRQVTASCFDVKTSDCYLIRREDKWLLVNLCEDNWMLLDLKLRQVNATWFSVKTSACYLLFHEDKWLLVALMWRKVNVTWFDVNRSECLHSIWYDVRTRQICFDHLFNISYKSLWMLRGLTHILTGLFLT